MAYAIGIDAGGTYTDAVLLRYDSDNVAEPVKKAKTFTTHDRLEDGVAKVIESLNVNRSELVDIKKVVLSTTLATNAIVEGNLEQVGLIIVGDRPYGRLATEYITEVPGKINIKGRVLVNVNREETERAVKKLIPRVGAIAISGAASVRNPKQEMEVKKIVSRMCDLPIMCGHEFANELGFLERTNTIIINAGLLPIIRRFLEAVNRVMDRKGIKAPIFVVKGDGSIATERAIKEKPIETAFSGPAASIIGAIKMTGITNALVADMGGTTTDIGVVTDKRVKLSEEGVEVGGWRLKIKSARLYTFGLGGDSRIEVDGNDICIGPKRVNPACRGGKGNLTPTDIVHYTGEFVEWDCKLACKAVRDYAEKAFLEADELVAAVEQEITRKIYDKSIAPYISENHSVCAIGAPVNTWYRKTNKEYDFDLIIPDNYEVANAVGAAMAGVEERTEAIIRPGEEGHGFLLHTSEGRRYFSDKEKAISEACKVLKRKGEERIRQQDMEPEDPEVECTDAYIDGEQLVYEKVNIDFVGERKKEEQRSRQYIETRIKVAVRGKNFI